MFVLSGNQVSNAKQIPTISIGSKQNLGVSLITKHLKVLPTSAVLQLRCCSVYF